MIHCTVICNIISIYALYVLSCDYDYILYVNFITYACGTWYHGTIKD